MACGAGAAVAGRQAQGYDAGQQYSRKFTTFHNVDHSFQGSSAGPAASVLGVVKRLPTIEKSGRTVVPIHPALWEVLLGISLSHSGLPIPLPFIECHKIPEIFLKG